MIIVHYSEMLPINGTIVKNEIYELWEDQFKMLKQLTTKQAKSIMNTMHKVYDKDDVAIYRQ